MKRVCLVVAVMMVFLGTSGCEPGGCWGATCPELGTPGGGASTGSCTDSKGVCIEIRAGTSEQVSAFEQRCIQEDGDWSSAVCPSCGGPVCRGASLSASGVPYIANICYGAGFCMAVGNSIDTRGSCENPPQSGTPEGRHCRDP